jgi:hypothetical protein
VEAVQVVERVLGLRSRIKVGPADQFPVHAGRKGGSRAHVHHVLVDDVSRPFRLALCPQPYLSDRAVPAGARCATGQGSSLAPTDTG